MGKVTNWRRKAYETESENVGNNILNKTHGNKLFQVNRLCRKEGINLESFTFWLLVQSCNNFLHITGQKSDGSILLQFVVVFQFIKIVSLCNSGLQPPGSVFIALPEFVQIRIHKVDDTI